MQNESESQNGVRKKRRAVSAAESIRTFAAAIGTTQTAVCYYISGKRMPSVEICVKIADVLGLTLDELVREK